MFKLYVLDDNVKLGFGVWSAMDDGGLEGLIWLLHRGGRIRWRSTLCQFFGLLVKEGCGGWDWQRELLSRDRVFLLDGGLRRVGF